MCYAMLFNIGCGWHCRRRCLSKRLYLLFFLLVDLLVVGFLERWYAFFFFLSRCNKPLA